jgi:hypothetical protein
VSVWPPGAGGETSVDGLVSADDGAALEVAGLDVVAAGDGEAVAGWQAARPNRRIAARPTPRVAIDMTSIVAPVRRGPVGPEHVQDPVAPNCDGVLRPDESLTNSSAGQHRPFEIVCRRVVRRPQAPDVLYSLRAAGLGGERRREEAQDQQHRQRDEESGPENGHRDLPNRCVHATETPHPPILFRCQ